jgi:Cu+-exporting ATPase
MEHPHHPHAHGAADSATRPPAPLASAASEPQVAGTVYTCPMHPEIRQDQPGNCPKCGMTLEPVLPSLDDDDNPELRSFTHRFWWTCR